jgi:myo-inositol-1(or 4)-monophosphatase
MGRCEALAARDIEHKSAIDMVTVADRESEAHVIRELERGFPGHLIVAEEGGGSAPGPGNPRDVWYVDPLDGTTNFVHGFPSFSVSMALYRAGRPVVAVVHAPALSETFHAHAGGGAFSATRKLQVSPVRRLIDALVATGFACVRDGVRPDNLENFSRLTRETQGVRRTGSAALDLAYVAAGRFDAFWEFRLSPWDLAAGALLVRVAGGRVTDVDRGDGWLTGGSIVATNGPLHEPLLARLDRLEPSHGG